MQKEHCSDFPNFPQIKKDLLCAVILNELKNIPTAENSWEIADIYDVKCIGCGKTVFAGRTREELAEVLAHAKYSRLLGREYLEGI